MRLRHSCRRTTSWYSNGLVCVSIVGLECVFLTNLVQAVDSGSSDTYDVRRTT